MHVFRYKPKYLQITTNLFRSISVSSVNLQFLVCIVKPDYGSLEVQRSNLCNGIHVAVSRPLDSHIASCTVQFQAGSRFEMQDEIGASHFLRATTNGSGRLFTKFAKYRHLQQLGAYLSCSTDRQVVSYTLRCAPPMFSKFKHYLIDAAICNCHHHWELDDCRPQVESDLARITPEERVMDLIQKASFGGPLSSSVFCEEYQVNGMTAETLQEYVWRACTPCGCTVASVGVPFEDTMKVAESIQLYPDILPIRQTLCSFPRGGYEFYDLGAGSTTWVALAVPGCRSNDIQCLLQYNVLAAASGLGNIQEGQHATDRVAQGPLGTLVTGDPYVQIRAFNISYPDNGIFGILVKSKACNICEVTKVAAEFLKNICLIEPCAVEVGKKRLKMAIALHEEDAVRYTEGLALQLSNKIELDSTKHTMQVIDSIRHSDVRDTACFLSANFDRMSMAVVGDVGLVPHDCELRNSCRAITAGTEE